MMKKLLSVLLCMLMITGAALAEENTAGTVFSGGEGYTLLYPADQLTAAGRYGHAEFIPADGSQDASFLIVMTEISFDKMEGMLAEAVGGYGEGAKISAATIRTLDTGVTVGVVQAEENNRVDRYYAISDGGNLMCVTASFPADSQYGALFDAMAESVMFPMGSAGQEALDAVHEGEGYTIHYPAAAAALTQQYGHDTFVPAGSAEGDFSVSMMIVEAEVAPEDVDSMLAEAVGGYGEDAQIGGITVRTGASGVSLHEISVLSGDVVTRFTLAVGEEKVLCVTTTFPKRDQDGFNERFSRMLNTIELK